MKSWDDRVKGTRFFIEEDLPTKTMPGEQLEESLAAWIRQGIARIEGFLGRHWSFLSEYGEEEAST